VLGSEIGQLRAGPLLEVLETVHREMTVGRSRQREDRFARLRVAGQRRSPVCCPAAHLAVLRGQVVDGLVQVERHTLGRGAE